MALPETRRKDIETLTANMWNVTAASSILGAHAWIQSPVRGRIVKIRGVLHGTIATTDAVITVAVGGTTVTGATTTVVASGSAAGDKYTIVMPVATATAAQTKAMGWVEVGDNINIISDGGPDDTVTAMTWQIDILQATSASSNT